MKPKLRITLLDKEFRPISDRLLDSYTETLQGPPEKHDGPYRMEYTITDGASIDALIRYIEQLRGNLPIEKQKIKAPKEETKVNEHKQIFDQVAAKKSMEEVIDYLDSLNFRFISRQLIEDWNIPGIAPIGPSIQTPSTAMVKVLRYGKNPANDKFDSDLIFYIDIYGRDPKIIVFFNGKKKAELVREWKKDKANMKQKKIPMIFPSYMTIEERKDWRSIRRQIENGKNEISPKKQKLYERYLKDIIDLNPQEGIPVL